MYFHSKLFAILKPIFIPLVCFLIGCASMYYWFSKTPAKTTIKTEIVEKIVEKEKIVYKQSSDKNQQVNEQKNIETRIITHADGSSETIVVDKSTNQSQASERTATESVTEKSHESDKSTKITQSTSIKKDWILGLSIHAPIGELMDKNKIYYQAEVSRSLLGPLWGSAFFTPKYKTIGIGFSLEF